MAGARSLRRDLTYTLRAVANESMTVSASAPPRVVLVMGPSCLSHCAAAPTLLYVDAYGGAEVLARDVRFFRSFRMAVAVTCLQCRAPTGSQPPAPAYGAVPCAALRETCDESKTGLTHYESVAIKVGLQSSANSLSLGLFVKFFMNVQRKTKPAVEQETNSIS